MDIDLTWLKYSYIVILLGVIIILGLYPCTSSLAMRISSLTLEKTVGSMKNPFKPRALPPHSSLAPSLMPLWTNSSTRFCCSRLICRGGRQTWNESPEQTNLLKLKEKIRPELTTEQNLCCEVLDVLTSPVDPAQSWDQRGCRLSSSWLSQHSSEQTHHIWAPPHRCESLLCSTGLRWKTLPGGPVRQPGPLGKKILLNQ